jgi:hypothetical protein
MKTRIVALSILKMKILIFRENTVNIDAHF